MCLFFKWTFVCQNDVDALKKNHQDEQTTLRHEIELLEQSISEKNVSFLSEWEFQKS